MMEFVGTAFGQRVALSISMITYVFPLDTGKGSTMLKWTCSKRLVSSNSTLGSPFSLVKLELQSLPKHVFSLKVVESGFYSKIQSILFPELCSSRVCRKVTSVNIFDDRIIYSEAGPRLLYSRVRKVEAIP